MRRGAPSLRLVRMQPPSRPHQVKATRLQRAHRQVSWAVYISEGYAQNARVALLMNAEEMPPPALHLLELAIRQTEGVIRALREHL